MRTDESNDIAISQPQSEVESLFEREDKMGRHRILAHDNAAKENEKLRHDLSLFEEMRDEFVKQTDRWFLEKEELLSKIAELEKGQEFPVGCQVQGLSGDTGDLGEVVAHASMVVWGNPASEPYCIPNSEITRIEEPAKPIKIPKGRVLELAIEALVLDNLPAFKVGDEKVLQKKTSADWLRMRFGLVILDPDGWDRSNYEFSFNEELITEEEFKSRVRRSTTNCHNLDQTLCDHKFKRIPNTDQAERCELCGLVSGK